MKIQPVNIAVLGIGYVGLPISIAFAKKYKIVAFDTDRNRIRQLEKNFDKNNEFNHQKIKKIKKNIKFTSNVDHLKNCNVYIITVPTPIDRNKKPDLKYLKLANELVGNYLKHKDIVIFESTVYPGLTEEFCAPILEKKSNLKYKNTVNSKETNSNYFYCAYSPERINPGDKKHKFENISKIVSASTPSISRFVKNLYSTIIKAKVYRVDTIKIAEAAKIIENTQRDLNIALINEFSLIFNKMNIDTKKILEAASTKWNFLKFEPGLVGGHCISVDPYYLTYKSNQLGYKPKLILAGRHINDNMGNYIAKKAKQYLDKKRKKVLIMGLSFKENCSDLRNSQVYNIYIKLKHQYSVDIYDPLTSNLEVKKIYKINNQTTLKKNYYNLIIISVGHDLFKKMGIKKIQKLLTKSDRNMILDIKSIFPIKNSIFRL